MEHLRVERFKSRTSVMVEMELMDHIWQMWQPGQNMTTNSTSRYTLGALKGHLHVGLLKGI